MPVPERPKIYHIVHHDRLGSILDADGLLCDAEVVRTNRAGTTIGMSNIKAMRLSTTLESYSDIRVGNCVPFYFCPRSVMLYVICMANHPQLNYRGGQGPIVHLEADLYHSVQWAEQAGFRWAFTLSNAGSYYFEDYCDLSELHKINWEAVQAIDWSEEDIKHGKQAEFLVECRFPWNLVERIGVLSTNISEHVHAVTSKVSHRPQVDIIPGWYY